MKLLYFSLQLPYLLKDSDKIIGGAAVQWKSWIEGFQNNNHEIGLLTWEGAAKYIDKKVDIDIVEAYDTQKGIPKIRVIQYRIPALFKAIKKYNPDYIIQGAATSDTGILAIISKILGKKFIHRVANDSDVDNRLSKTIHWREILLYKIGIIISDIISVQNEYQFEKLTKKYPNKNIFIAHNPYAFTPNNSLVPKDQRKYIAWIGNFRTQKNIPELVNAAKRLPDHTFKIAGKEFPNVDKKTLSALIELNKLSNVEFVGYLKRNEVNDFLKNAILLLNTAFYEGFSNTFLEAWSCGTPVVSTVNVNPDKIITKYRLGKVAKDYNEIPKCINSITNLSDKEYNMASQHYHDYVLEYHNPQKLAKKFISHLNNVKNLDNG